MVVENYFNKLKDKKDIKIIKGILREYDKNIDSRRNSPVLKSSSNNFTVIFTGYFISICAFLFGDISPLIKLIYTLPLFIVSTIDLILFLKLKKNNFNNRKLFYQHLIIMFFIIILMLFTGTYAFQFFLFKSWKEIDYLKSILLLASCLIPIIIATLYDAPKKFLKEFVNTNNKYKSVSTALSGIISTLVIIFNIFKPYYLILVLSYVLILWLTKYTTYLVYKYKQYDLIEDLRNQTL
jgi:hypothetical protein